MASVNGLKTARSPRPAVDGSSPVPYDVLEDPTATVAAYSAHLARTGLSPATIRAYGSHTASFAHWLTEHAVHHPAAEAFTDPHSRDYACRDYRSHLMNERRLASGSIDAHLAALDGLYLWVGLGRSTIQRTASGPTGFGQHLDARQSKAVLRAAERRGIRDLALVATMRFAGLRVSEVAALNVDDVWITPARGAMEVRGKGAKMRTVPLSAECRKTLGQWLLARRTWPGAADTAALFVGERGTRLTDRAVRYMVSEVGQAAGVPDLHPHTLRHTCARRMLDGGAQVTEVQMVLGHASLATTMAYTRPSQEQYDAAVEAGTEEW